MDLLSIVFPVVFCSCFLFVLPICVSYLCFLLIASSSSSFSCSPDDVFLLSVYTVEIFLMHELIMHKSDNASIFAVTELVPI